MHPASVAGPHAPTLDPQSRFLGFVTLCPSLPPALPCKRTKRCAMNAATENGKSKSRATDSLAELARRW